jgi:hypothetical protein
VTEPKAGGKGRPTPKRSQTQHRRSGPVAPPPKTRKEAAARARAEAVEARTRSKAGGGKGDDRHLMKRDAGPVRRLVRDTVDSRRNIGVLILPLALLLVASAHVGNQQRLNVARRDPRAGRRRSVHLGPDPPAGARRLPRRGTHGASHRLRTAEVDRFSTHAPSPAAGVAGQLALKRPVRSCRC